MLSLNKYSVLFFVLLLSMQNLAFSQKSEIQNFENINIVTDRNLYMAGEPIWVYSYYSVPVDTSIILSKVLYLELFNNEKQLISSQKTLITKGVISSKLIIPEYAQTGYYVLRAYTRYQENFPTWQLASVVISIVNPEHPLPPILVPNKEEQITISSMLDGNIAFRIREPITQEVKSVDLFVNESKVNQGGKYYSNGLGIFNYNPKPTDQLKLLIHLKSGDSLKSSAIIIKNHPFKLTTSSNSDKIELNFRDIAFRENELKVSLTNFNSRNSVTKILEVVDSSATLTYSLDKLGTGLTLISISDNNGDPVFNTFCYIDRKNEVVKEITTDNLILPDENISVDMSDINSNEYPLVVSMVLNGAQSSDTELLPAYIIDNPLYIDQFMLYNNESINNKANQITNALAMAQDKLSPYFSKSNSKSNLVIPEIDGLTIQGRLVNPVNKQPVKDELIYCSLLGNENQFHATRTSEQGSFIIPLNLTMNRQDIYLTTGSTTEESDPEIVIDNGFYSEPPIWFSSSFIMDSANNELITQMYINYQVNKIFNINRQQANQYTIPYHPVFGDNLKVIRLTDFVQMSTTLDVRARKKDGQYKLVVSDDQLNVRYEDPLVIVDQLPYYNIDEIMKLQPTEIEKIEVSNHTYIYGNNMFNGIIMITTNSGNLAGLPLSNGGVFAEYETFEPDIQFVPFSKLENNVDKPDFANTVYFNSIDNKNEQKHLLINAPTGINNYDILLFSLRSKTKVISRQKIKVSNE
jgi:hypothetical protein